MQSTEIVRWLEEHPGAVRGGDPGEIVSRFEREVRQHAAEDAWLAAKSHVERRMREWETEYGALASEAHVAREICPRLASELRRQEPHPKPGDVEHLAGSALLAALAPEARAMVSQWILELAEQEEHAIWEQIVRFTRSRGRGLVRERRISRRLEVLGHYYALAALIARILAEEYESRAHPRH